jgi:hypothetical protein
VPCGGGGSQSTPHSQRASLPHRRPTRSHRQHLRPRGSSTRPGPAPTGACWSGSACHQTRRVALDPETVELLTEHYGRCAVRAKALGVELDPDAFVFSGTPDGSTPLRPDSVTQGTAASPSASGSRPVFTPCGTTPPPSSSPLGSTRTPSPVVSATAAEGRPRFAGTRTPSAGSRHGSDGQPWRRLVTAVDPWSPAHRAHSGRARPPR